MITLRNDKRMRVTVLKTCNLSDANSKGLVKKLTGTTELKMSSSKQRKHHQMMIRKLLESKLDTQAQYGLAKDRRSLKRITERAKHNAKYGNIQYMQDGVTIDTAISF